MKRNEWADKQAPERTVDCSDLDRARRDREFLRFADAACAYQRARNVQREGGLRSSIEVNTLSASYLSLHDAASRFLRSNHPEDRAVLVSRLATMRDLTREKHGIEQ